MIELEGKAIPEVALWRAVIALAVSDATMVTRPARVKGEPYSRDVMAERMQGNASMREQARAWLTGNSRDFRNVCEMALLDAAAVRESAQAMARRGWPPIEPPKLKVKIRPGRFGRPRFEE
jgi:hypothetical protein